MSKNDKTINNNITLHARNTLVGTTNRRGEFVPAKDENNKLVYSSNLGVTFRNADKSFEPPVALSADIVRNIQKSFPKIKNVSENGDSVIEDDSITHFKATGTNPEALGVTYKPLAADIALESLGL